MARPGAAQGCPGEEQAARRNEDELVHPHRDHPRGNSAHVESYREPYSSHGADSRASDYQGPPCRRQTHPLCPPDLWLTSDRTKSAARLVTRGIAAQRLAERGFRRGRVAFHEADVPP